MGNCSSNQDKPVSNSNDFVKEGIKSYNQGDFEAAMDSFNKALHKNPEDTVALLNRGNTYVEQDEFDAAIEDFTEALRLKPQYTSALYNRGLAYLHEGKFDAAITDFTETLHEDPGDISALFNRGGTYLKQGEFNAAISDFTEILRIDPEDTETLFNRGETYLKQGEFNAAISDFTETLRIDPEDYQTLFNRGRTYLKQGQLENAIKDFNETHRIDPQELNKLTEDELKLIFEKKQLYRTLKNSLSINQRLELLGADLTKQFKDPITLEVYNDPIMLACGHNLEKESLSGLQENEDNRCPCCRHKIRSSYFSNPPPNLFLKNEILKKIEKLEKNWSEQPEIAGTLDALQSSTAQMGLFKQHSAKPQQAQDEECCAERCFEATST